MEKLQVVREERFKCVCGGYINANHPDVLYKDEKKTKPICPECGLQMTKMCKTDHPCTCGADIHSGIRYCPECGEIVCPCGSSDTSGISRVTGYLQTVESFNRSKQQEAKDRHRWNLGDA